MKNVLLIGFKNGEPSLISAGERTATIDKEFKSEQLCLARGESDYDALHLYAVPTKTFKPPRVAAPVYMDATNVPPPPPPAATTNGPPPPPANANGAALGGSTQTDLLGAG